MRVEADLPGQAKPLVIYAIHAPTPRTFAGWEARNRYLDVLAERIAAEPEGAQVVSGPYKALRELKPGAKLKSGEKRSGN